MKAPEEDRRTGGRAVEARIGRFVYGFSDNLGSADVLAQCGGKGSGLIRMHHLGLPVPEGFVITTEACVFYIKTGEMPEGLMDEVKENLQRVEEATGRGFGDTTNPLLVSVRSGAPVSMPGMMETILNLGLNDRTVVALGRQSGSARFAYDSYRRFIQMYSDVVLGVPIQSFEHLLRAKRMTEGVETDAELSEGALRNLVEEYKSVVRNVTGHPFPMDPQVQLWGAIEAVW